MITLLEGILITTINISIIIRTYFIISMANTM